MDCFLVSTTLKGNIQTFENILDEVDEMTVVEAVRKMNGVFFHNGPEQVEQIFDYDSVEKSVLDDHEWATKVSDSLQDVLKLLGPDRLAAIRIWTGSTVCYVVTSVIRDESRTVASVQTVLPFLRLLYSGLHKLPRRYLYVGQIFRAEYGCRSIFPPVIRKGFTFGFYPPTSFTANRERLREFKSLSEERSVYSVAEGVGYRISDFSHHPSEEEVLVEGVIMMSIVKAERYDEFHDLVELGEVPRGLHRKDCLMRPGVPMLSGSPAHECILQIYRRRMEIESVATPIVARIATGLQLEDLEYFPFPPTEWIAKWPDLNHADDDDKERSFLGKGSFGITYRMRHRESGVPFAVKVVEVFMANYAGLDIECEAKVLGLLRHRHVITCHGLLRGKKSLNLVMDLATGGNLADLIHLRGRLREGLARDLLGQLAAGLEYVHGEGVLHRDIKPHNILLNFGASGGAPWLRLADFGLSSVLSGSVSMATSKVGTGIYASPEKASGQRYGSADDMWAVGCVLVEMLLGSLLNAPLIYTPRRGALLAEAGSASTALGTLLPLLVVDAQHDRLSAWQLRGRLNTGGLSEVGRQYQAARERLADVLVYFGIGPLVELVLTALMTINVQAVEDFKYVEEVELGSLDLPVEIRQKLTRLIRHIKNGDKADGDCSVSELPLMASAVTFASDFAENMQVDSPSVQQVEVAEWALRLPPGAIVKVDVSPRHMALWPGKGLVLALNGELPVLLGEDSKVAAHLGSKGRGDGQLMSSHGVAVVANYLVVSDPELDRLVVFGLDESVVRTIGCLGRGRGQFRGPAGVSAAGQARVAVADRLNNRVQVVELDGSCVCIFGEDLLISPRSVRACEDGRLVVACESKIFLFKADGTVECSFGELGPGPGQFSQISDVVVDFQGRILVADGFNNRVQVLKTNGKFEWRVRGRKTNKLQFPMGLWVGKKQLLVSVQDSKLRVLDWVQVS